MRKSSSWTALSTWTRVSWGRRDRQDCRVGQTELGPTWPILDQCLGSIYLSLLALRAGKKKISPFRDLAKLWLAWAHSLVHTHGPLLMAISPPSRSKNASNACACTLVLVSQFWVVPPPEGEFLMQPVHQTASYIQTGENLQTKLESFKEQVHIAVF